ncbi:MAG: cell division protein FtsA [Novosphingobium sp. 28-62-57]|uniref:cell division protein FtsA n=1 Tax=unclassified Novosphingobium TaxID=2644732 RepID=UPI000BDDABB5|nr:MULTISPECIES: cell division protein FtsA [unclassified Novosphingobium]OYW50840.1 MAG: cell division protein FtsA [Novosphingobium sp. 12-62-10]OYZ10022.1 MAG: cell division protein FtsA [Novosphingobium sp. 28-62-57]OZA36371.1 MAG: cell division protein FtsA [Novosphingobium sp. 17-62-9]HQS69214.1 cell division protein FtsA [Novosphingobium sp.]
MATPRITKVFAAVNIGSFRVSAMIAGLSETGDMVVLGSGHRAAQGIKRGYVTDMQAATHSVRDAVERAEKMANIGIQKVWIGCSGAGLGSTTAKVEVEIGGRRIEQDDIEHLLVAGREVIEPDGRTVLHAQPAHYTLDGAHGVPNPKGLHAERLAVDIHVMLADGAPIRNLREAVQNAHLDVETVVGSPIAAGHACLTPEERELGVALVEFGAEVTTVSVHAAGMLLGMQVIQYGSGDITDAIASAFGIRRYQAERLKCMSGSAIASPADHREMIPVNAPGDPEGGPMARHADDKNRIPRAELISVITQQLGFFTEEVAKALKAMGFVGQTGQQVVLTGGGAQLPGLADYAQSALGRPVRIGSPPTMLGLPPGHATPSSTTLVGLILFAAADPVDIRSIGPAYSPSGTYQGWSLPSRLLRAVKDYF